MVIAMYYLNLFLIYSILGHLLEKILFFEHQSGILYGFWTPVYGFGSLIVIGTYIYLCKKTKIKKWLKYFIVFLVGFIFLPTIELIGGVLIEKIFHITFWDYSDMKFHIGKYASLEMAFVWAITSLLLVRYIQPIVKKIALKVPHWLTYTLSFLFLIDIVCTLTFKT